MNGTEWQETIIEAIFRKEKEIKFLHEITKFITEFEINIRDMCYDWCEKKRTLKLFWNPKYGFNESDLDFDLHFFRDLVYPIIELAKDNGIVSPYVLKEKGISSERESTEQEIARYWDAKRYDICIQLADHYIDEYAGNKWGREKEENDKD